MLASTRGEHLPFVPRGGDRVAPITTEAPRGDPDADRGLTALVFVHLDEAYDLAHVLRREAHRDDLGRAPVMLDIRFEYAVEHVVWRQRILIELIGAQFRRRRACDDPLGD